MPTAAARVLKLRGLALPDGGLKKDLHGPRYGL